MKEKNANIAAGIVCLGLAYMGFEYESGWAFLGSVLAFLSAID